MKNFVRFFCFLSIFSLVFIFCQSCHLKQLKSASRIPVGHEPRIHHDFPQPTSLEDLLKDLKNQGAISYSVPSTMTRDVPQKVELSLSIKKAMEELKKSIVQSGLLGTDPAMKDAVITDVMAVQLIGDSTFQISPSIGLRQSILPEKNVWNWTVTPLQEGQHNLVLKLSAIVQIKDKNEPRLITSFDNVVTVLAPPFSLIDETVNFLKDNWAWILLVLAVLVLLVVLLRGKKPGNTTPDPFPKRQ